MDKLTSSLIGCTDAQVWAKEWLETISKNPDIPTDEGTMIAWFANAIESGRDRGQRDEQKRDIVEKLREIIFKAARAATVPLLEDISTDYIFPSDRVAEAVEEVCSQFGIPKENNYASS